MFIKFLFMIAMLDVFKAVHPILLPAHVPERLNPFTSQFLD